MNHEETVRKVLSSRNAAGALKSRESNTVEFKESFNKNSTAKYAKTMAAYSNNRGGYIIFGVKDNPRMIIGLKNDNFENMSQEQFSETINSLFAPAMDWDCGKTVETYKKSLKQMFSYLLSNNVTSPRCEDLLALKRETLLCCLIFFSVISFKNGIKILPTSANIP